MKRITHFLFAFLLLPGFLEAQEVADASFLTLTPDAQSAGMAGTGMATINNGSNAIFHNLSTLAFSMESMGTSYSYADICKDFAMHSASLFYRIGQEGKHGFAVGFRHYKQPEYALYESEESFRPRAWSLDAGYFRCINPNLSMSLTFRYLQAKAFSDADTHRTVCLDFGVAYHRGMALLNEMSSWTVAFQAANLGRKLDGQKLPARVGVGGSIELPFSMNHYVQVAADINYLLPSEYRHLQASIGAEYNFLKYGVLRAGHHFGDKDKGVGSYNSIGCGINFWPLRADFSYALADKDCFMHKTWQLSVAIAL